jgi:hypothetical protein
MGDHKSLAVLITDYWSLTTATSIDPAPALALKDSLVKPRYGPPIRGSPVTPVLGTKPALDFLGSLAAGESIEGSDLATASDLDLATISSSSIGTVGDSGAIEATDDHDNDDIFAGS